MLMTTLSIGAALIPTVVGHRAGAFAAVGDCGDDHRRTTLLLLRRSLLIVPVATSFAKVARSRLRV